jgi:lysozyme family protein
VKQKFAPELAGMESADVGDVGDMESALSFFMQGDVAAQESASIDLPPYLADGPFQRALQVALRREAGYVDHPADRGGPTNNGISQKALNAFLRARNAAMTDAEVDAIPLGGIDDDLIAEIYYLGYWRPARCVDMPNEAIAAVAFDAAVNHGAAQAIRLSQQGAGMAAFDCDGLWSERTRNRLKRAAADSVGLIDGMLLARERFYRQIVRDDPSQGAFLRGWMNRLAGLKAYAKPLLANAPAGLETESALLDDTLDAVRLRAADPDFSAFTEPTEGRNV